MFHVTEAGGWPAIRRVGLLSTTALLDRFEIDGDRRERILSRRRPENVEIRDPVHGMAVIRDNKPLRERALAACLDGMSPREWYETLNARVFFWVDRERAVTLVEARAHRSRDHDVLVVDTRGVVARHRDRVALAAINTGAALFGNASRRGPQTFRPLTQPGATAGAIELSVEYAVRDIDALTVRVERWRAGCPPTVIWTPTRS